MVVNGRLFIFFFLALAVVRSDVLPWSPDEGGEVVFEDVLLSLNNLEATLLSEQFCDQRMGKLWDAIGRRKTIFDEMVEELLGLFDDLNLVKNNNATTESCPSGFQRKGNGCYYSYTDSDWVWWRSRFFCFLKGGDLTHPGDLRHLRDFLPETDDKYWIGGRTSSKLEFPEWLAIDGKRIQSEHGNFTTIPRSSDSANCLAVDGSNSYQLQTLDCEVKLKTVCQKKLDVEDTEPSTTPSDGCSSPYAMAGDLCLYFHREPLTWKNGRRHCNSIGGHLAFPDFERMGPFLSGHFEYENWNTWVGGRSRGTKSVLKGLNGTEILLDERTHRESGGDCLAFQGDESGQVTTFMMACNVQASFLCQENE